MINIRNCIFGFKCTADWYALNDTEDPKIRFCLGCKKDVYKVATKKELYEAIELNRCVAIFDAKKLPRQTIDRIQEKASNFEEENSFPEVTMGFPRGYSKEKDVNFLESQKRYKLIKLVLLIFVLGITISLLYLV